MRFAPRALSPCLAALVVPAAIGCSGDTSQGSPFRAAIHASLVAPRALLVNVSTLTLSVYETTDGVDCDGTTGRVKGRTEATRALASKELVSSGCAAGARFCGELEISQAATDRVFFAVGASATEPEYAVGCTRAKVQQEALALPITMVRNVPPAVCGDGVIQPTEQCDPGTGTDPVCDSQCHTKEIYLSAGSGLAGGTAAGKAGDKVKPAFVWPAEQGRAGKFLAFFGDKTPGQGEITMRVLDATFGPYTEQSTVLRDASVFLPNTPGNPGSAAEAFNQANPAAAAVGASTFVAFEDDATGTLDIHLRSLDGNLGAQEPTGTPVGINGPGGAGESGAQAWPAMAPGPGGLLFVVWQSDAIKIAGRTLNPQGKALGNQLDLSSGTSNKRPQVAGRGSGWAVVWESGADVKLRTVGADGSPTGAEQTVNEGGRRAAQPAVAALADGRFAVAFAAQSAGGGWDVYVQRFDAQGQRVAGDQGAPLNDLVADGDQTTPAVAALGAAGGAYAVAWLDESSDGTRTNAGHVRARYLGGTSGFLFNNVTGQTSEFPASVEDGVTRGNPTVVAGGAGPFVAFGWEAGESPGGTAKPGIYGRRFPLPKE